MKIDIDNWWKERDSVIKKWQSKVKEEINEQVYAHIIEISQSRCYWIKFTHCPYWLCDEISFVELYLKSIGLDLSLEEDPDHINPTVRQADKDKDEIAITLKNTEDFWTKYAQIRCHDKIDEQISEHLARYEQYFDIRFTVYDIEHTSNLKTSFQIYIQDMGLEVIKSSEEQHYYKGDWYYSFKIRVPYLKKDKIEVKTLNTPNSHHKKRFFKRKIINEK